MPSTVSMTRGNTVVVTHVHPANPTENAQQHNLVGVRRFIKGQPQALGVNSDAQYRRDYSIATILSVDGKI
ncbi:hypothetical protein JOB18_006092 [Solea senegalensis]|uniref:Uncharacterized protein n=1 Tax=Solea senegalensis TaxID=28829 RepID=A0AAV6QIY1_SOLSE|nr:hypothetical protein JOB18_006092 [Solea senegalensis]